MKAVLKFLLKIFLLFGIPMGLPILLPSIFTDEPFDFETYAFFAVGFGGFMTFILGSFQIWRLWAMGVRKFSDEDFKVKQSATVASSLTLPEIADRLQPEFSKVRVRQNKLTASSTTSIFSWYEDIEIIKLNEGENRFEYRISSTPGTLLTIIDYGKNRENVLKIQKLVKRAQVA